MSNSRRRFVIAYISLVGVPLLCLAGVLRAGHNLTAPISINGSWKIDADAVSPGYSPCRRVLSNLSNSALVVSQSGRTLVVTLNGASNTTALGVIDGNKITASVPASAVPSEAACSLEHLTITATVDSRSEPKSLNGSLSLSDCSACLPLQFKAIRLPRGGEAVR